MRQFLGAYIASQHPSPSGSSKRTRTKNDSDNESNPRGKPRPKRIDPTKDTEYNGDYAIDSRMQEVHEEMEINENVPVTKPYH
jgi:hypothetical protein